jgi:hypothetical protein
MDRTGHPGSCGYQNDATATVVTGLDGLKKSLSVHRLPVTHGPEIAYVKGAARKGRGFWRRHIKREREFLLYHIQLAISRVPPEKTDIPGSETGLAERL